MSDQNGLSGRVLYKMRLQQMLYDEREMSSQAMKKEVAILKLVEEKRIFLEENSRAVMEIERSKCLVADRDTDTILDEDNVTHVQLVTDAGEFIEKDKTTREKGLDDRVKNEYVDDERMFESIVYDIDAENYPTEAK